MDVDLRADASPKLEDTKPEDTKFEDTKPEYPIIGDAGSGTISPDTLDVKDEIVLPDAPAEQYTMVKTILANTVTEYLKEMGYFPGQLEMFKRLRSNNHDFFEETEQLQQIVNQQQHHIANLEHQIRQGAAELDRTTHDLHAVLRNYHTLAGSYDRLAMEYRTVWQRFLPHERPPLEFPLFSPPGHPTYGQIGPGPQAMIPAATTPGMDYIPRISHVQPGVPMQGFAPPGAVVRRSATRPAAANATKTVQPTKPTASAPVVPQIRPRPRSRNSLGTMPPPTTIPSQSQSGSQSMPPPPPPPVAGPSQPRGLGTIRIPARRAATMPAPVIDLTANDSESDDQESARKRPRIDDAQSESTVPPMSLLDMQTLEDELKRSVVGSPAAHEPGPSGDSVSSAMPANEEPIDVDDGDEDDEMSDRLDENGLLKPEFCIQEAYEEHDGKLLCKMCRLRSAIVTKADEEPMEPNNPDLLVEHLETVHPQGWARLRGVV